MLRIVGSLGPTSDAVAERLTSLLESSESPAEPSQKNAELSDPLAYRAIPSDAALAFALSRSAKGIIVLSDSVAHEEAPDLAARLEVLCTRPPRCPEPLEIEVSTIEDFAAAQNRTDRIADPRIPGITLVETSEFDRVAKERARHHVDTDLPFLIYVSPAGFSSDRRQALIFLTEYCGSLCGGGFYLVLEQRQGAWWLSHAILAWVS